MKKTWINKDINNHDLILFFNGWGMDENPFSIVFPDNKDLLMFSDYGNSGDSEFILGRKYRTVSLIAWSYGVWAAEHYNMNFPCKIDSRTAINGTPFAFHDLYGIKKDIAMGTFENLSDKNVMKFFRRMFSERTGFEKFEKNSPSRDIENIRNELQFILKNNIDFSENNIKWDRAYISTSDRIFPPDGMARYWSELATETIKMECGHFPFYEKEFFNIDTKK